MQTKVRFEHVRVPLVLQHADHPWQARGLSRLGLDRGVGLYVHEVTQRQVIARDGAVPGILDVLADRPLLKDVSRFL